jgi:phosphatidylinositol alpha-1,6-mannosyltransferase
MARRIAAASDRLLFVTTELFAPGGVQRLGRDAVDALAGQSADPVDVWSFRDATVQPEYSVPARAHVRLAAGSRLKLGSWAIERARHRCDDTLVIVMHVHVAPIAIPMLLRGARAALFLLGVEVWRPLTAGQRFVADRCERLIAISHHTADRFTQANPDFKGRPIEVCHLGITAEPRESLPALPGANVANDTALMVSRMSSEDAYKGHERLIRAWPAVKARVPYARLVLIGEGDDRRRLEAIAAELGVAGAVRFAGFVTDEELAGWYRRCTFFVLPSDGEGFGLVFLEAMREGKACIGGPGAPAEIVEDGVTGFIIPSGPSRPSRGDDSLVDALSRLFLDDELRDRLGRNGQARFRQTFTARHFTDRLLRLIPLTAVPVPEHAA